MNCTRMVYKISNLMNCLAAKLFDVSFFFSKKSVSDYTCFKVLKKISRTKSCDDGSLRIPSNIVHDSHRILQPIDRETLKD